MTVSEGFLKHHAKLIPKTYIRQPDEVWRASRMTVLSHAWTVRKTQVYPPLPFPSDSLLMSLPMSQFQMVRQYWHKPRKKKANSNFTSTRHRNLNKNCWEGLPFPSNLKFFCNATLIFSTKLKYMMLKISKHFMHEVPWYLKLFSATPWRLMRLLITDGNGSGKWVVVESLGRAIICFCGPQS